MTDEPTQLPMFDTSQVESGWESEPIVSRIDEPKAAKFSMIEFGEPESVLDRRTAILDLLECRFTRNWYMPPIPLDGLTRAFRANAHHESALRLKKNLLVKTFRPTKLLSRLEFGKMALDFLVLGNGYLQELPNRFGQAARYERAVAKYVRRGAEEEQFWQVLGFRQEHEFERGSICHAKMPCLDQEIYGVPEYMGAMQSALLNENATLFRRRYYLNGAHAGSILHLDGQFDEQSIANVRDQLSRARGMGNFKNLLLVSNGDGQNKEKVKLIPIAEVAAKDEFTSIKNATQADVLAVHRTPPEILGIAPTTGTTLGDRDKVVESFMTLEIQPMQVELMQINDIAGATIVDFAERQTS